MPSLDATITWATQVEIEPLCAHPEAYVETLPALNNLRLCQRFGRGPHCIINKLPVELLQQIEGYVTACAQREQRKKWNRALRCLEGDCTVTDHVDREELLPLYYRSMDHQGRFPKDFENPSDKHIEEAIDDLGSPYWDHFEEGEAHSDNRGAWDLKITRLVRDQQAFMQQNFGLGLWTSHVRISNDYVAHFGGEETIIAYLTMPDGVARSKNWTKIDEEYDEDMGLFDESSGENGFGMPIVMGSQRTKKALERFPRTMKLLNLKTHVHKSQKDEPLVLGGGSESALRKSPRPTLLLRNKG